jgi:hypothetical protein
MLDTVAGQAAEADAAPAEATARPGDSIEVGSRSLQVLRQRRG